jgi:hypothetical protein
LYFYGLRMHLSYQTYCTSIKKKISLNYGMTIFLMSDCRWRDFHQCFPVDSQPKLQSQFSEQWLCPDSVGISGTFVIFHQHCLSATRCYPGKNFQTFTSNGKWIFKDKIGTQFGLHCIVFYTYYIWTIWKVQFFTFNFWKMLIITEI